MRRSRARHVPGRSPGCRLRGSEGGHCRGKPRGRRERLRSGAAATVHLATCQAREEPPVDEEASAPPLFAPAVMEAPTDAPPKKRTRRGGRPWDDPAPAIEVDGVTVRVGHGARAKTIAAVIRALKAGK